MREVLVIGIGAGDPDHVTVQAVRSLNRVDVFFLVDKGEAKSDLNAVRHEILRRHVADHPYRVATIEEPTRDRAAADYNPAVDDWRRRHADLFAAAIADELGDDDVGAFLVWGDPAIYDGTTGILDDLLHRGGIPFTYEVLPGISSVQALTARLGIPLSRVGEAVTVTTGRRLAEMEAGDVDNVVVMLDASLAFTAFAGDRDLDIHWGAYLGTDDELVVSGPLHEVAGEIERIREQARARKGWVMDTYLLRRRRSP